MTTGEILIVGILFMIASEVTELNKKMSISWLFWITSFIIYGLIIYREFT